MKPCVYYKRVSTEPQRFESEGKHEVTPVDTTRLVRRREEYYTKVSMKLGGLA